jgi:hypothetical protein
MERKDNYTHDGGRTNSVGTLVVVVVLFRRLRVSRLLLDFGLALVVSCI